ncbi:hypothetical protein IAU60_002342 [Kwoniella sp. DSM 27419]
MSMPLPARGASPSFSHPSSTSSSATITPGMTLSPMHSQSSHDLRSNTDHYSSGSSASSFATSRLRSNSALSPRLSPINTSLVASMHSASRSLGSQLQHVVSGSSSDPSLAVNDAQQGDDMSDVLSPVSPEGRDDVALAVRGLRGALTNDSTGGSNGNVDGMPSRPAYGRGRSSSRDVNPNAPGAKTQAGEEALLRRIQEALGGSSDEGDTLDMSRQDIRGISDAAVEQFAAGVGRGKKGVWRLALSYNALRDGCIADSFCRLSRLRYLNLKGNYLTQFPSALPDMPALEILDLSKNRLTSFPDQPGRLTQLKVLSLTNNKLYTLPGYLVEFAALKVFKVDHNPLEWPPKEVLGPLCASEGPTKQRAGESGSATDGRSRKDEDLRPWIENMKSWMRQRATESQILLQQAVDTPGPDEENGPQSAKSSLTSTSYASVDSGSSDRMPVSQETYRRFGQPLVMKPPPITPTRSHIAGQRHRAATLSDDSMDRVISPGPAFPKHARNASSLSISSLPPDSAGLSAPSNDSDELLVPPVMPIAAGHTRGASYTATQRLSANLTVKKSLPDLRQSHAQIIRDRRNDGQALEENRPLGLGIAAPGVAKFQLPGKGSWDESIRSPTSVSSFPDRVRFTDRRGSAEMLRRGSGGDLGKVSESLDKRHSQEGPQLDESRNSYFRRLSTLPVSTLSKAIPPALLKFIDAIRGILYALSQLHSALRQYLVFAVSERVAGVFARVMEPASNYMNTLINALDRFDSMSRRVTPPVHAIRSVIDAAKESVAVFAKVVAVLRMQVPALKENDVRYTRTLLTMIYGSMAEVVRSWQTMAPLLNDIKPLLVVEGGLLRGVGGQKMIQTGSMTGRTPISPIIERRESQSPASTSRSTMGNSPLVPQVEQPPAPNPSTSGVTSMRTMGRARRQARSFSSIDVERGMLMASPGPDKPIDLVDNAIQPPYLRHKASESATISLNEEIEEDDDDGEDKRPVPLSTGGTPPTDPGTPPDLVQPHILAIAIVSGPSQQSRRGHHPTSSSGSSHALSQTPSMHLAPVRKLSVDVRPPTPASASVFDEDLLDVIETATDIAFTCWLKLAEDVGGSPPPFASHHKSASQSSTASGPMGVALYNPPAENPRRPPTISPKHHQELLLLLSQAEQITTALRESLMGLRANPMTYPTTTLPDDAQHFIKTVVRVSELVKAISSSHQFPAHVRQACSRLTQATRECAILIQVSSLRPGNATPAHVPMSATPSASGHRPMSPYRIGHQHSSSNTGTSSGTGSQEDLPSVPFSAGRYPLASPGLWGNSQAGGVGSDGTIRHKEGLRGLQLPARQMAISRSRSSNAIPPAPYQTESGAMGATEDQRSVSGGHANGSMRSSGPQPRGVQPPQVAF